MTATITGVGAALPKKCVTNDAFAHLGLTEKWIISRSGVERRYHLDAEETLVGLAAIAAQEALDDSGVLPEDIDMVVVATSTPDRVSPGLASELAFLIGAEHCGAIDLNGACTGFLYALDYAMARIDQGSSETVLVVGADAMSRLTDPTDRDTAFLFGDGAGAVIVTASEDGTPQYLSFGSAGEGTDFLSVPRGTGKLHMDGVEVYAAAVDSMSSEIEAALVACGDTREDIDLAVCHQANIRIVNAVGRELGLPREKVASYVADFGNTSSASIPIALWKAQQDTLLKPGDRVALAAFGAGFTWGAGILNWKGCANS